MNLSEMLPLALILMTLVDLSICQSKNLNEKGTISLCFSLIDAYYYDPFKKYSNASSTQIEIEIEE
jgi:hypothetical protein